MWGRITKDQRIEMLSRGYNERDIYRALRNNRGLPTSEVIDKIINQTDLRIENAIDGIIVYIRTHIPRLQANPDMHMKIKELQNECNRALLHIEQKLKK